MRLVFLYFSYIKKRAVAMRKNWTRKFRQYRVFSVDIGVEFGIEKCAMLVIEKGTVVKSVGIELPDSKVIKPLQEGESYKYLRILKAAKEYFRRLKKVLKSKLNGGNLVQGVNT